MIWENDEVLQQQQQILNDVVANANFDLSDPNVLAASIEYDRLMNERMHAA